jgi:hypothetical protein
MVERGDEALSVWEPFIDHRAGGPDIDTSEHTNTKTGTFEER